MNQPGDLALHRHQWATLIFSSNEGQSLHRRSGWDLKAPVLVVPRVALARLAMENEKTKSRQPSNPISNPPRKGLRSKTELYQPPDPPQAPSPPRSTYPTWNFHLDQTHLQSCRQKRPSSVRPRMVQGGVVGVLVSVREAVKMGGRFPSFGSLAREVAAIRHIAQ